MEGPTLYRRDLDAGKCANLECTHHDCELFLSAACHPHEGLIVRYEKATGRLELSCSRCGKLVARVGVAGAT